LDRPTFIRDSIPFGFAVALAGGPYRLHHRRAGIDVLDY
jgi:hypothetical protein